LLAHSQGLQAEVKSHVSAAIISSAVIKKITNGAAEISRSAHRKRKGNRCRALVIRLFLGQSSLHAVSLIIIQRSHWPLPKSSEVNLQRLDREDVPGPAA